MMIVLFQLTNKEHVQGCGNLWNQYGLVIGSDAGYAGYTHNPTGQVWYATLFLSISPNFNSLNFKSLNT